MSGVITDIKDQFLSDAASAAYDAAFDAGSLPDLGGSPLRRHRLLLRYAATYPALAVELGRVTGRRDGGGGLRSVRGTATLYLAIGRADETVLIEQAEAYADALREAVETTLTGGFESLTFSGALVEGEVYAEGGVPLRLVPVSFDFVWLYLP
jgi:hypothetical protein